MIVIVDGYNVLKRNSNTVNAQERGAFIHMLSRYGAQKNTRLLWYLMGGHMNGLRRHMNRELR
jgi:predicted RNA-binding protein with PIN domain